MKKKMFRISMFVVIAGLCVTGTAMADWIDGFEDGLVNWTMGSGTTPPAAEPFVTMNSYTIGTFTVDPHSGSSLAVQNQSITGTGDKYWLSRTNGFAAGGDQGTLTGYVNIASSATLPSSSMLMGAYDNTTGKNLWLAFDRNNPKLYYRGSAAASAVYTSIDINTRSWHKVEFVVGDSGTSLYVDDTFIFTDPTMTKIDETRLAGTFWGSSPFPGVLLDDISFVSTIPEPATMSLLIAGLGFAVLGRKRK